MSAVPLAHVPQPSSSSRRVRGRPVRSASPAPFPVRYRPRSGQPADPGGAAAARGQPGHAGASGRRCSTSGGVGLDRRQRLVVSDACGRRAVRWPQFFGVTASPNAGDPANFDLSVVYCSPPGAGHPPAPCRSKHSLTLAPAAPELREYAELNAQSQFDQRSLRLHATCAGARRIPARRPRCSRTRAPVNLEDTTDGKPYLTLQADQYRGVAAAVRRPRARATSPTRRSSTFCCLRSAVGRRRASRSGRGRAVRPASHLGRRRRACVARTLISRQELRGRAELDLSAVRSDELRRRRGGAAITLTGALDARRTTLDRRADLLGRRTRTTRTSWSRSNPTARARCASATTPTALRRTPARRSRAIYRIGNGTAGNVGARQSDQLSPAMPSHRDCTNPLPASGGSRPGTAEQIRRRAPQAFLTQERAVTMARLRDTSPNRIRRSKTPWRRCAGPAAGTRSSIAAEPAAGGDLTPDASRSR